MADTDTKVQEEETKDAVTPVATTEAVATEETKPVAQDGATTEVKTEETKAE